MKKAKFYHLNKWRKVYYEFSVRTANPEHYRLLRNRDENHNRVLVLSRVLSRGDGSCSAPAGCTCRCSPQCCWLFLLPGLTAGSGSPCCPPGPEALPHRAGSQPDVVCGIIPTQLQDVREVPVGPFLQPPCIDHSLSLAVVHKLAERATFHSSRSLTKTLNKFWSPVLCLFLNWDKPPYPHFPFFCNLTAVSTAFIQCLDSL